MKQYVCLECHNVFEEDEIEHWYEKHGLDCGPYEYCDGSPCCHASYVDAYICDSCGDAINTDRYIEIDGKRYCEYCFEIHDLNDI